MTTEHGFDSPFQESSDGQPYLQMAREIQEAKERAFEYAMMDGRPFLDEFEMERLAEEEHRIRLKYASDDELEHMDQSFLEMVEGESAYRSEHYSS